MTVVEHWRWRYRHPKTGKVHRTSRAMTAQEAARYPDATRIEGTRVLRQAEEQLDAGNIVLAGSFTRPATTARGDCFHVDYGALGSIAFRFA